MTCAVIIPVGPGHETLAAEAVQSVLTAKAWNPGPFTQITVARVDDTGARLGRSAARNKGMDEHPADWHFLLDADDRMRKDAFTLVRLDAPATFGAIEIRGRQTKGNRYPVTRETLFEHGASGTLCMGCFVRGDLGLRFDESLHLAEDFDYYMRLPGFVKLKQPLVTLGYRTSAGGPHSSLDSDWWGAVERVIATRYTPKPVRSVP